MPEMRVQSGDRIAVLGSNGCGKSTLLNLLYHLSQTDEGVATDLSSAVTFHDRCRLGYYDQSLAQLDDQQSLSDALCTFASINHEQSKRALISAGFGFARHGQQVASLSGGERARLLFVGLTLARYHLLFLDEPTNHLDMEGKEELIETLNQFEGATLLVSHDRSLIEQSCNRFWLINDGVLSEYLTVEEVYQQLTKASVLSTDATNAPVLTTGEQLTEQTVPLTAGHSANPLGEEQLLERLIELETLLADDQQRKPKHQKPNLQLQWQKEIEQINLQL
jgi:ATPase subunit of ABC transporter with duplicated ATPase domains